MDDRWEAAANLAVNFGYLALVAVMVIMVIPGLRVRLAALGGRQAYAWRYGRWLGSQTPTPQWTRLLERADLPSE